MTVMPSRHNRRLFHLPSLEGTIRLLEDKPGAARAFPMDFRFAASARRIPMPFVHGCRGPRALVAENPAKQAHTLLPALTMWRNPIAVGDVKSAAPEETRSTPHLMVTKMWT